MTGAKYTPGQLGDPNAEQFYLTLIDSKEARTGWSGLLVPKTDAGKRTFARKCLDLIQNYNRSTGKQEAA